MKWVIYIFLLIFFCISTVFSPLYSQETYPRNEKNLFIGLGGGLSTYLGGSFGKMYAIRYKPSSYSSYNDYYYRTSYYNRKVDDGMLYPLQFDLTLGYRVLDPVVINVEASFLWHNAGKVDLEPQLVTSENEMYRDEFEPSSLIAIPMFASVKVFPFGSYKDRFYLSVGYGVQYAHESVTKWRNYYYSYNYWYENLYYYSTPLAYYEDSGFMQGFKVALGLDLSVTKYFFGNIELRFTNFYLNQKSDTPLALTNSSNMMNLALISRFFISF